MKEARTPCVFSGNDFFFPAFCSYWSVKGMGQGTQSPGFLSHEAPSEHHDTSPDLRVQRPAVGDGIHFPFSEGVCVLLSWIFQKRIIAKKEQRKQGSFYLLFFPH